MSLTGELVKALHIKLREHRAFELTEPVQRLLSDAPGHAPFRTTVAQPIGLEQRLDEPALDVAMKADLRRDHVRSAATLL